MVLTKNNTGIGFITPLDHKRLKGRLPARKHAGSGKGKSLHLDPTPHLLKEPRLLLKKVVPFEEGHFVLGAPG